MNVTLVRHGQTEDNYSGVVQGLKNNLLSDTGRRQCQKLRDKLKDKHFDVCYMSPLVRTVETAMILIGDRVEMIPDKRIIERDMGKFEGKPHAEYDAKKYWNYEGNCNELGVESIQDVFKRCQDFLDYIFEKHGGQDILIVTHTAVLRVLRHLLLKHKLTGDLLDINVDNCYCEEFKIK